MPSRASIVKREADDHRFGAVELVGVALDAQQRADARPQLGRVERLADEIVGAGLDPADAARGVVERRDEHDRNEPRGRILLDRPTRLEPVDVRHHHVHQDEIGRLGANEPQRFGAVGSRPHGVAVGRQQRFDQPGIARDVIDDQHGAHGCSLFFAGIRLSGSQLVGRRVLKG